MKSKSNQIKPTIGEKQKAGKSYDFNDIAKQFDFVGLYRTADETNEILEKYKTHDTAVNKDTTKKKLRPKVERLVHKSDKNKKLQPVAVGIAQINIDGSSFNSGRGASAKAGSKPVQHQEGEVKSIMKTTSVSDQQVDNPSTISNSKPKKRNKSVSFMLDDTEEVVVKRTKSEDSINVNKKTENEDAKPYIIKKKKTTKKDKKSEKENTASTVNKQNMDVCSAPVNVPEANETKNRKTKMFTEPPVPSTSYNAESLAKERKKKVKKIKKHKTEPTIDANETEKNNNEVTLETTTFKKLKKKKEVKHAAAVKREGGDGDGEPVLKSRKKEAKSDLAEDLENLRIGDNAHSLSNMLDEMTVVDKNKRKKMKQTKKNKKPKIPLLEETQKTEEVKEKEKWKKRKWNKDRKGEINNESLDNTVIVENLPISIMLNYKKLLTEYFIQFGLIKKIGMAEVYPTEESRPVFTTTIIFNSDGAAKLALEEDNVVFKGSRIRVKRPLPATATTIVVRSYAELTDQSITTLFHTVGRIRNIRHLVKGKKSMATAFIEFDGPEAVERALNTMTDVKIGGKKLHVAKFEPRPKKKNVKKPKSEDSAAEADSEDSND